jgi:hypothetical protein
VKREAEMAINYRTHFAYRIDLWDADGENVIEHLAGVAVVTLFVRGDGGSTKLLTAKLLGIEVPPSLLVGAEEMIE